jgi:hypothetical protein
MDDLRKISQKSKGLKKSIPSLHEIIRGTISKRYMTCGKLNCKCHKGKKHGPYHYITINYPGGKIKSIKIPNEDILRVKRWQNNYQKIKNILEKISNLNLKFLEDKKKA